MTLAIGTTPRPPAARPHHRNGFTLIELCLVLGLMAVLVGLTWPVFERAHHYYLFETTAQDLVSCMTYARANAIAERIPYQLVFQRDPVGYKLAYPVVQEGTFILMPASGRWGRLKRLDSAIDFEIPADALTFYPNGSSTSAQLTLKDSGRPVLTVTLEGSFAHATIQEKT